MNVLLQCICTKLVASLGTIYATRYHIIHKQDLDYLLCLYAAAMSIFTPS